MPRKKSSKSRKPFWERTLERFISFTKILLLPALIIWLIGWLWLGGVFDNTRAVVWDYFVNWTADQGLVISDVMVDGRYRTDVTELQKAIDIEPEDPLLDIDIRAIKARVSQINWVDDLIIRRSYNGLVKITLIERIPFVVWDRPGRGSVVVDTNGEIIPDVPIEDFQKLLTVRGVDAPKHTVDLMQLILAEPNVATHIAAAEWIGDRRWDLLTVMGVRVHLPEDDVGHALSRLAKIQAEKNILGRDLQTIDLRGKDRIIVETERGQSLDMMNLSSHDKTNMI